jgi:RNA polymerase subunit RPABC4/transcription elongation factor Spt4
MMISVKEVEGSVSIFGEHMVPAEPEEGEDVEIFVLVTDTDLIGISSVECIIGNSSLAMDIYGSTEDTDLNWTRGVLYTTIWEAESGDHNISFRVTDIEGNITSLGSIRVSVEEDEKEDTIFGLPRTYCAISAIFITLMIIFLTWSYFKGRRMQKEMGDKTGASMMACSACGTRISPDDDKCPKCGAEFDEEEHVCGSCGEVISEDDDKCPKCGAKLKSSKKVGSVPSRKKDRDLEKLKRKVDMKGKVRCANCGTVYLKKEKSCPECSEE